MSPRVGPYTLLRRLGVGGMGEVWMAEWSGPAGATKQVALKLLRPEHLDNAKLRAMFLSEARLAMLLNNSNIVQVFDVGENESGTCYMAMEWVDGLDLAQVCKQLWTRDEQLPLSLVAYIIGELLKALACAHDFVHQGQHHTIVHRDVTPHNVMLSVWGEVKLMDFGVARMASEQTSGLHAKGKLRYMPPEQLSAEPCEPTLDLFAVGAILHELLDGRSFRGADVDEARLIGKIVRGEIDELRDPSGVPSELRALRRGLLEAEVEDRIQSARDAHRLLARWPDYRDAKFELEDLVRALRREEPRLDESSRSVPSPMETTDGRTTPSGAITSHVRPHAHASPPPPVAPAAPQPRRRVVLASAALASALGLVSGAAVISQLLGQAPVKALELPSAPGPMPTPEPEPWQPWTSVEAPPLEPPEAPKPKPKPKPKRVGVTLRAPSFFFVELRVNGSHRTLDHVNKSRASLQLLPGRHTLEYREPEGRWRSAGGFVVEADTPMIVTLKEGGSLGTLR